MVNELIHILNESLDGLTVSQAAYGLAQTVERITGTEREILPGVIGSDGECKYVGIDDIKSLIVYHKLNSSSTAALPNGKGENPGDLVNTFSMSMYLYWDRKRFNKQPDEVLILIQARWPQLIMQVPDAKTVRIRVGTTNFNSLQIYSQEYALQNARLPPQMNLAQFNYTIEITFNPACLNACP